MIESTQTALRIECVGEQFSVAWVDTTTVALRQPNHHDWGKVMCESNQVQFSKLKLEKVFVFSGALYIKMAHTEATLLRDKDGLEPQRLIKHGFYPEELVDPQRD